MDTSKMNPSDTASPNGMRSGHTGGRTERTGEEAVGPRHPLSRPQLATAAALWIAGVIALAILSVFAHNNSVFPGDVGVASAVQTIKWPPLVRFINLSSDANWPFQAGITVIVVVVALLVGLRFREAICVAIAGFAADVVNVTLNGMVARPRPNNVHVHVVAHLGLHSFPSGHVTHVVAFYGFLFYLSHRAWQRARASAPGTLARDAGWVERALPPRIWSGFLIVVQVVSAYFIVFIGLSRVLEGEHWPSDVLASYLLGSLALTLVVAIYQLLGVVRMPGQRGQRAAWLPETAR